jgi:hypothetical protein
VCAKAKHFQLSNCSKWQITGADNVSYMLVLSLFFQLHYHCLLQILNQQHPLFQAINMFHGYLHNVDHQRTTKTFELQTGPEEYHHAIICSAEQIQGHGDECC